MSIYAMMHCTEVYTVLQRESLRVASEISELFLFHDPFGTTFDTCHAISVPVDCEKRDTNEVSFTLDQEI